MLYVNPNFGRYVEGKDGVPLDAAESDLLLERLYLSSPFRCRRLPVHFTLGPLFCTLVLYFSYQWTVLSTRRRYSQAFNVEYQCLFTYNKGDMTFWDNRSCMHRAVVDFSPHHRILRRVTLQGSNPTTGGIPYYDADAVQRNAEEAAADWAVAARQMQETWVQQAKL